MSILFSSLSIYTIQRKMFVCKSMQCDCLMLLCCFTYFFKICEWFYGRYCRCCFVVIRCVTMVYMCDFFTVLSDNMMQAGNFVRASSHA